MYVIQRVFFVSTEQQATFLFSDIPTIGNATVNVATFLFVYFGVLIHSNIGMAFSPV